MNDTNLATIQRIHSIRPHPNADTLSVAKVLEWPVVVKNNQFIENELVVFIEIDSIVPEFNPYFEFMRRQNFRTWNARFRGEPSSGLVCPLSILSLHKYLNKDWVEGEDISAILNIKKYERPIDVSIGGDALGGFPTKLISITDEDNLLSHAKALNELSDGQELYATEKADGCLDENTLLLTADGLQTIKDVCNTKYTGSVLSIDFDKSISTYSKITNHFITPNNNDWYEIELENGLKIKLTGNHKVFLPEFNCFREVVNLTQNDKFLIEM